MYFAEHEYVFFQFVVMLVSKGIWLSGLKQMELMLLFLGVIKFRGRGCSPTKRGGNLPGLLKINSCCNNLKHVFLFFRTKIKLETTMYKLQCSGVFHASGSLFSMRRWDSKKKASPHVVVNNFVGGYVWFKTT